MKNYRQFTSNERYIISFMQKQGFNPSQIGRQIGGHRCSICREWARNTCHGYDHSYRHYTERDFAIVRRFLRKDYSPEQIVGIIRRFKLMNGA